MKEIDKLLYKFRKVTNAKTDKELCEILNISYSTLDTWKNNNKIPEKRLFEITEKIKTNFNSIENLNSNVNNQTINDNHGNLSQNGNVYGLKENDGLNIDEAALSTFKRAYSKCTNENGDIIEDKLDELIIYLTKFK